MPFFVLWIAYNEARWHVPWDAGHTIFYHQDPFMGAPTGSPFGLANVPVELYSFFVVPPRWHASFRISNRSRSAPRCGSRARRSRSLLLAREPRRLVLSLWLATLLVAGPSLLYYANGGSQFGMRHALDFEPFVLALMGLAARQSPARLWRAAQALIVWSVIAGMWGCWYWNTYVRPET